MRRSILIYNPKAGQGRAIRSVAAVASILRRGGWDLEPVATRRAGDATGLAHAAAAGGVEAVFVLGGDGTLREAGAGLLGLPAALGALPGGTTNVLTGSLGLPREPEAAASVLCRVQPRPMDVGMCGGTPFLMMASTGLDSHVVSNLNGHLKQALGVAGMILEGLGHWLIYDYPELEVEADGHLTYASLAIVSNIPHYGGPFRMAPLARFDDRRLDLVLFRGHGRSATLGFVMDVVRDAHVHRPDVEIRPVRHVVLRAPGGMPLQVDGDDSQQTLPVTIELAAEQLQVLAPRA